MQPPPIPVRVLKTEFFSELRCSSFFNFGEVEKLRSIFFIHKYLRFYKFTIIPFSKSGLGFKNCGFSVIVYHVISTALPSGGMSVTGKTEGERRLSDLLLDEIAGVVNFLCKFLIGYFCELLVMHRVVADLMPLACKLFSGGPRYHSIVMWFNFRQFLGVIRNKSG